MSRENESAWIREARLEKRLKLTVVIAGWLAVFTLAPCGRGWRFKRRVRGVPCPPDKGDLCVIALVAVRGVLHLGLLLQKL
jgi:hypothetical protein